MVASLKDTASGICGAWCCTYAGLPFDVAKVRLQSQQRAAQKYSGVADCMTRIVHHEGFRSLFRGAIPALSSAVAENAVGITVQRAVHRRLGAFYGDPHTRFSCPTECFIGAFTGCFTCVAMCPFEVTKVRLQAAKALQDVNAAGADANAGVLQCMRSIMKTHGVRGFYTGLAGLWARDIPYNAVFYGSYESICTLMMWLGDHKSKDQLNAFKVLLAGGCAGGIGWSLVIPFDVVKTRLQTGQVTGNLFHIMHGIARDEGFSALFSGWGAAVSRAFPANAGLFLGVEISNRWLQSWLG